MLKILKNGQVFTGLSDGFENLTVVIEGKKIKAVGSDICVNDYPEAEVIDLQGQYVLPGLIDCHVHIGSAGKADDFKDRYDSVPRKTLRAAAIAKKLLQAGFTTVRSLGTSDAIDIELARAIDQGLIEGTRIIPSGAVLCMTGGHGWSSGREVDGADEARKGAREQLRAGAQVIKLMATGGVMTPGVEPGSPQLTLEEMQAAIEEAHKAGCKTATHAQGTTGIKNAIKAGIDSIEHGIFLDEEAIQMMLERQVALVPTLVAPYHIVRGGVAAGIPEYAVRKAEAIEKRHIKSFQMALEAGVTIALGTDAGTPLNVPGNNAFELELLVKYGMSPVQALKAVTSVAAQVCDRSDLIGSIEPNKFADFVVVAQNPLEDITILQQKPAMVIKEGHTVA